MITIIDNFLTKKECEYIKQLIDENHYRSSVAGVSREQSVESDFRTSSTCSLPPEDEKVFKIKKKIAAYLNIDIIRGEDIQGQLYEPGQFFKPHTDYFDGDSFYNHCLASGNRTDTLMIFLNDDLEGGSTFFPNLNQEVKPKTGRAVVWQDMKDGEVVADTLHEGQSVISGKKYIITSWWREKPWIPQEDVRLSTEYWDSKEVETQNKIVFKSKDDLPKLTETGYKVVKCPENAWGIIQDGYRLLMNNPVPEEGVGRDILDGGEVPTEMMSFDNLTSIRDILLKELEPIHREFCGGLNIEPAALYGIRSYNKGATLVNHTDRIETHHVSSIIIVDKDLDCGCVQTKGVPNDWPLQFQDHNGEWHDIYADIGDIILYESATCMHGRPTPFKGNWFRNFYVHYKLTDYVFQP